MVVMHYPFLDNAYECLLVSKSDVSIALQSLIIDSSVELLTVDGTACLQCISKFLY